MVHYSIMGLGIIFNSSSHYMHMADLHSSLQTGCEMYTYEQKIELCQVLSQISCYCI